MFVYVVFMNTLGDLHEEFVYMDIHNPSGQK